jgi:PAS domain-containing protein
MEHRSAERLANLLTLSYEPMLAWKLDGAIEFWNAGAERLYGFPSSEAVGTVSHALLQTKFPIEFNELRSRLCNERYRSGELCHTCKDSHEVIVDSRMQLIGEDIVLEVNRDVTETESARHAANNAARGAVRGGRHIRSGFQPIRHFRWHGWKRP